MTDILMNNTAYYEAKGFKVFNGHTFKFYDKALTWKDAKTACEAVGGHLATSTSTEKNAFLTSLTSKTAWLGATDEVTEGFWKWITGEAWSYTNWISGMPDNAGGTEHYLEINMLGSGLWNDYTGTAAQGFICEWDFDITASSTAEALTFLNGYRFFNGHTFKCIDTPNTWTKAKAICEAVGGHLATSTSAEKNAFLSALINGYTLLGGTDEFTEGTWKWVTGDAWNYTNWGGTEPNNSNGVEHYLMIDNTTQKWNDIPAISAYSYLCEWDFDFRPFLIRNHEGLNNLLGGAVSEHYHLNADELSKLHKILDLLFPDGAVEPRIPTSPDEPAVPAEEGSLFGGLSVVGVPQWTSVRMPNYSNKVQYSCYNAVHSMYYGTSAAKKGSTPQTRLHVLMEYGNNSSCYLVSTQDLNTWTAEHTFNKKTEAGKGISQFMYINTGNSSSAYQHRLYITLPGRTSKSNMIRFLYGEQSSGKCNEYHLSQANVGSKTPYVACCYSDKLKIYIFVSEAGNVARVSALNPKDHKVYAKEKTNNCGISVNSGCAAWSSYANVFCVTGIHGAATSSDGKGAWTIHSNAPKNLVDLVYREDLPGTQPKGFFARSAEDNCFYASADGVDWQKVSDVPIPLNTVDAVAYAPDLGWYCAIGGKSKYAYFTNDLVHWNSTRVDNSEIDMGSVIWMPNVKKFVLMPKSGTLFYTFSPDDWRV